MEIDIPAIDIAAEQAITETIRKAKESFDSLNLFKGHPWIKKTVDSISTSLGREFELPPEDIRLFIIDELFSEIHTVTNPNHRSPCECLYAWTHKGAFYHCINETRHLKVVKRYEEAIMHQRRSGKLNSVSILRSASTSPLDQLLEKEEEHERESQTLEVRARVRRIVTSYPHDHITIAYLWGNLSMAPKRIAAEIQTPVGTVYGRLESMQKAVIKEIGIEEIAVEETAENRSMVKEGLRQLFASSLEGHFRIALTLK